MSNLITNLNDDTFEAFIKDPGLTIVDFWAPWCGPCKSIAPILDEVAKDNEGKVKIGKVNVDENKKSPTRFGVRSIPNLIFFKAGQQVAQVIGAKDNKGEFQKLIDQHLTK